MSEKKNKYLLNISLEGCVPQIKHKIIFKNKFQDGAPSPKMIKSEKPESDKTKK